MANTVRGFGFDVILKPNAWQEEMENAIRGFEDILWNRGAVLIAVPLLIYFIAMFLVQG